MNKQLLLFDFDGTVIDNSEGIYNCIKYALNKMDLPIPQDSVLRKFIGPSLFDSFYEQCEQNGQKAEQFVKLYRERFSPVGHSEVKLYPEIKNAITRLVSDGYRVAVCSSKPLEFVKKIAVLLNINNLFEYYSCPDFATHASDKTSLINAARQHFGCSEDKTLMIGDTKYDIRAAKAAGIEALGVSYGFCEPGELEAENADYIAGSAAEMYRVITGNEL